MTGFFAAQGAIEKSDESFRIVHDAAHGVNVHTKLKMRDQVRMPTAGDGRAVMELCSSERPGVHFALQADVSKAHRRYLHKKSEWGLLACKTEQNSDRIWLNKVGIFGCSTAGYWWSRLIGAAGRAVLSLLCPSWFFLLDFADDLRLQAFGPTKYEDILLCMLLFEMMGTPFSWKKCRGGLALDWLGYWIDYQRFEVGVSEKRALWLIVWGEKTLQEY